MIYFLSNLHYFLLMISAIVVCHELGHFIVAKLCGVQVTQFSIGFGPILLSTTYGETVYQISLLPLGGYVKMLGDMPEADVPEALWERSLSRRPVWQRMAIVLAGPGANMLLAFAVYLVMGYGAHEVADTRLGLVTPGEAADLAGLRPGDRILTIDGVAVDRWEELRERIGKHPGEKLRFVYERQALGQTPDQVPSAPRSTELITGSRLEPNGFGEPEARGKVGLSVQYLLPLLGIVDPTSPAARAGLRTGDRILQVNGTPVEAWHEVRTLLAACRDPTFRLAVQPASAGPSAPSNDAPEPTAPHQVALRPAAPPPGLDPALGSAADTPLGYTGLTHQDTVVAEVDPQGAASRAGLQVGDRVLALHIKAADGKSVRRPVNVWEIDLATFGLSADSDLSLEVQRGTQILHLALQLTRQTSNDALGGLRHDLVFGATNAPDLLETYTSMHDVGLSLALQRAWSHLAEDTQFIGKGLIRLVRRSLPLSSMGGPIMLFVIAERSAKLGATYYFQTMALISVNVGLINLMPIPVLDGGHLSFFAIEAVSGRPPSPRLRGLAQTVGLVLLMGLMLFTLGHDAWRFIF